VTLSIADSGSPFDPTSAAPKARAASLADATPGGLGLVMMRENANRLVYRRSGGRNHIDMLFQFDNARPESTYRFVRRSTCTERRKIDLGGHVQRSGNDRRVRNLCWIPLFKDAQPHAVEAVLQACELLEIAPHTPLLVPGQSNRSVYIALSGTVVAHLGYPHRPQARDQQLLLKFLALCPQAQAYHEQLGERRLNVRHHVQKIVALAEIFGPAATGRAITDAHELGAYSCEYIANLLEQRRRCLPEPGALHLTRQSDLLELELPAPDLSLYHTP
jgi:hypothetical protein